MQWVKQAHGRIRFLGFGLAVVAFVTASVATAEETAGAAAAPAAATTVVYVSPTGDDANPGTKEQPLRSLEAGLKKLAPGVTLQLAAGTYPTKENRIELAGTAEKPIVVRGEAGTKIVPADQSVKVGFLVNGSWVTFENIELDLQKTASRGFTVGGKNFTFRNCHIHDYINYAIITWNVDGIIIENCELHGASMEHGIYFSGRTDNAVVRNCAIYDTAINGVHINTEGGGFLIENNIFHHNSREWGACITQMNGAHDITIRNNLFYCNYGHLCTMGGKDVKILHNTICQPAGAYQAVNEARRGQFLVVIGPMDNWLVRNNVLFMNSQAFDINKPEFLRENADFDFNVYSTGAGAQMKDREKHGVFGADLKFVKAPGPEDRQCDLHLVKDGPGTTGAPLLKELCPLDRTGQERKEGGPAGAFAEPEK